MLRLLTIRRWTLWIALIVLAWAVWILAWTPGSYAASQWPGHQAHHAVWKIIDGKRKYQASAFAAGPRLVVTVAHNHFDVLEKAKTDQFVLEQSGRERQVKIARPRSISATHDLALLETATAMEHHLAVARALPHGPADQFHIAGYPKGRFETLQVITTDIHGDVDYYDLPMDRVVRGGISGSPVLAPNGEVIALQRTANDNVAGGVKFEVINKFLDGKLGVMCGSKTLTACLEEATKRTKQLAVSGNLAAQFQLGREGRYITGEPEMRWLRRAAEGGHASAQLELGNALFDGARGLAKDWPRSNYWLRLAAEQEDAVAQNNLSIAYLYGEGVPRDLNKSLDWLLRSLHNGYVSAEYNLGVGYYEGDGLPMDKELGVYWLQRAADRGDEASRKYLEEETN